MICLFFLGDAPGRYSYCLYSWKERFVFDDVQREQIKGAIEVSGTLHEAAAHAQETRRDLDYFLTV